MLINYSVYQSALFLDILEFSMLGIIKSLKLTFCMALHLSVYTSKTQLSLTTLRLINIFTMSLLLLLTQYPSLLLFPSPSTVSPILLLGDIKRVLF